MLDASSQPDSVRTAVAAGRVVLGPEAFEAVREKKVRKGDVLTTAQIAGIQGSKKTSHLIPLCHDVQIDGVEIEFAFDEDDHAVNIRAFTKSIGLTGVEMEALTAVSISALTIYDMCKSIARDIYIEDVRLLAKTGGQSGNWKSERPDPTPEPPTEAGPPSIN
jgi:molybdenum cofactor biosynthesis protein MoaC